MAEVQRLQREVQELHHKLAARDNEIHSLKEIAEAVKELQSQDLQASKVIELSKKVRQVNLYYEKEKQKVARLQQSLSEMMAQKGGRMGAPSPDGSADGLARELQILKDRMGQQTNRMAVVEQKAFLLETDNKKLVRALQREVGDDVPLPKVLEEGSDWRGRREQIASLREQLRQLKEAQGLTTTTNKYDAAHRRTIGNLTKERNAELDRANAELAAFKEKHEQLQMQYAGANSRRKILEDEVASLKQKLVVVLNKTKNDNQLIVALREELAAATRKPSVAGMAVNTSCGGGDLMSEVERLRAVAAEQEEQIEKQQQVIRYLQQAAGDAVGLSGATAGTLQHQQQQVEELRDVNEELRQQVAALKDDLAAAAAGARPGTSGMSAALRQQVLLLQEENDRLRSSAAAGGVPRAAPAAGTVLLTEEQQEVLLAAQEAVQGYDDDEEPAWDPAQEVEEAELPLADIQSQKSLRTVGRKLAAAAEDLAAELEAELSD